MAFNKLGLNAQLIKAITTLGYQQPTAIQQKAIPIILSGKDLLAAAQTGTGKTAAFVLPILQTLSSLNEVRGRSIRALILAPTRELVIQVEANIVAYAHYLKVSSLAAYGGSDLEAQKQQLATGVDILVATPGRLLDLAYQRALFFDDLEFLVLDEADKMLDMGFIDDLHKIIERLPTHRQSLLFSATLTDDVRFLANIVNHDAIEISISPSLKTTPKIKQWLITVDKDTKSALLSHLIQQQPWEQALIFVEKKHSAAKLVEQLGKRGIIADAIHGGRSQAMREQVWQSFKNGQLKYLVATGIAARGLDIEQLERVVNYDLPFPAEEYIHRIGRTGRAGATGEAISLVSKDDFKNLCAIESLLGHIIERKEIEGFSVKKEVPISILNYRP